MHRLSIDIQGRLALPEDLRRRYRLRDGEKFLLEKTESGLALHLLRPGVRKVYLEPTTRCNLNCRTLRAQRVGGTAGGYEASNMAQLSYRQVLVGKMLIGVLGLDELFDELYTQGRLPDEEGLGTELAGRARKHNYIPPPAVDEYARALLREYREYAESPTAGYGAWRGHPREHIPWFPTLATDLCDNCGACLKFCSFGVFETAEDGKIVAAEPLKCQVGCSACVTICRPRAISFPPRTILDAFRPVG